MAAGYLGGLVLLQQLFIVFTGQKSTLAVVGSTLLIAALFNPLRRRIKAFIDKRFFREEVRYEKTTSEVLLQSCETRQTWDPLSEDFVEVVKEGDDATGARLFVVAP